MPNDQELIHALDDIQIKLKAIGLSTEQVPHLGQCREIIEEHQPGSFRKLEATLDRAAMELSRYSEADRLWPAFARFDALIQQQARKTH